MNKKRSVKRFFTAETPSSNTCGQKQRELFFDIGREVGDAMINRIIRGCVARVS